MDLEGVPSEWPACAASKHPSEERLRKPWATYTSVTRTTWHCTKECLRGQMAELQCREVDVLCMIHDTLRMTRICRFEAFLWRKARKAHSDICIVITVTRTTWHCTKGCLRGQIAELRSLEVDALWCMCTWEKMLGLTQWIPRRIMKKVLQAWVGKERSVIVVAIWTPDLPQCSVFNYFGRMMRSRERCVADACPPNFRATRRHCCLRWRLRYNGLAGSYRNMPWKNNTKWQSDIPNHRKAKLTN